jgi:anion-transporting  ArsA/GET3 family ATPase
MTVGAGPSLEQRRDLLTRRIILITGKGGVGRTTMTAAIARAAVNVGRRVLIAEIGQPDGDYSPLARIYGRETLPDKIEELEPGVRGQLLWPRQGHQLFVERFLPVQALARAAMRSKALSRLLDAAPSFSEMGIFYQLLDLLKATRADGTPEHETILVDMPATGHTLALTGLPDVLLRLMPTGPIAELLREGQSYLNDPRKATCCVVTLPETLPVSESLELIEGLRETRMDVGAVLVNKYITDYFTPQERAWLTERLGDQNVFGRTRFLAMAQIERSVQRLRTHAQVPVWPVPEFSSMGTALIDEVSASLVPR